MYQYVEISMIACVLAEDHIVLYCIVLYCILFYSIEC